MKLTKRKGFNFFRSYFDVYNELNDKEKVMFIDALLDRQFLGVKPKALTGMAKFAYISQTNSIDSQVKGFEDKTGIILTPTEPPTDGGNVPPTGQVEEKGQVKVEGKGRVKTLDEFENCFDEIWKEQMQMIHKGKDLGRAIQESYAHLTSDPRRFAVSEVSDYKKVVNSWLSNQKPNGQTPRKVAFKL